MNSIFNCYFNEQPLSQEPKNENEIVQSQIQMNDNSSHLNKSENQQPQSIIEHKESFDQKTASPNQQQQQQQQIHSNNSNEILHSESFLDIEKIEDIEIKNECKSTKVLVKKVCILKEIINEKMSLEEKRQSLMNEFKIMNKLLYHPNILKVYDIFLNDDGKTEPSILIEYYPITLEKAVLNKKLSNVQQIVSIYQIAEVMKYIHLNNIVHHNLKPSNILISEKGIIKIGGFENSQIIKSEDQKEQLLKNSDVCSFGDVVYFILTGGKTTEIKNDTVLSSFHQLAKQLIIACWCFDDDKPTFEVICQVLEQNDFNLISLSQSEIQEIYQSINQYKNQVLI